MYKAYYINVYKPLYNDPLIFVPIIFLPLVIYIPRLFYTPLYLYPHISQAPIHFIYTALYMYTMYKMKMDIQILIA